MSKLVEIPSPPSPAISKVRDLHAKGPLDELVPKKYRALLKDPWVRRWYYDKCKKSTHTGRTYVKVLGRVMERMGCSPSEFIALEQDDREGRLIDYLDSQVDAHRPDGAIDLENAIVKSWMSWRRVPMTRKTNRHRDPDNSRNTRTRIPGREDLRRLMIASNVRARFLIACTAYSAIRPYVLSDQDERDGLRFADLPEAHVVNGQLEFDAVPTLVKVRWNLSKNRKAYATFFPQETCSYLKTLTDARLRTGEPIKPDSLVFPPKQGSPSGFLGELQLHNLVREPMNKVGLTDCTPYTWKSYCIDGLMHAERDTPALLKEYRMFMVGHECGLHADYALRKGELTTETVEAMRIAYEACATRYLEAFPVTKAEDLRVSVNAVLLEALGYKRAELEKMDLSSMSEEELVALARDSLTAAIQGKGPRQRVVTADQWEPFLDEGWAYKTALPDGRILMERV
jgi:hypothetical protein